MDYVPPKRVFRDTPKNVRTRHEAGGYTIEGFLYPTKTKNGGMASVFQGHPYPRKGFIWAEAVMANNKAKRATLALFKPFTDIKKGLKGFLESYLYNYIRLIHALFADYERIPLLHYEYYCEFSKSLWQLTYLFFRKLGVRFDLAYELGSITATIFEFDDAYRVPAQDIFSETSKERLIANPRGELFRLLEIYKHRSTHFAADGNGAGNRIEAMSKMFSYLLYLPPVKRAFTFALENINFKWLQYDEIDVYWSLSRADYEVLGIPMEMRKEKQIEMMMEHARKNNPGKEVVRIDDGDRVEIRVIDHDQARNDNPMDENSTVPVGGGVPTFAN